MTDATGSGPGDLLHIGARWTDVPEPSVAQQLGNLVQVYALYSDAGRPDELAQLFTADARWDGSALGYGTAEGAEAIGALVAGHHRPAQPMMHVPGPPLLAVVSEDEVHGVCWCLATRWTEGTTIPFIHFYYADVFRRLGDGQWRFAQRVLCPAFPPTPR